MILLELRVGDFGILIEIFVSVEQPFGFGLLGELLLVAVHVVSFCPLFMGC